MDEPKKGGHPHDKKPGDRGRFVVNPGSTTSAKPCAARRAAFHLHHCIFTCLYNLLVGA
jgi:hypothetical protein